MNLTEYAQYDGMGLAELVRNNEITAKELVELAIQGVEKLNPQINSVIEVYPDALEIADAIKHKGPFWGVPFLRKDIGAAEAGRLKEMGSRLFKGIVSDHDAYLTINFKKAGLVILGRSAVPELGISGQTESILYGITRNPWDLDLMAGGSSGGAAASVASGILPIAQASDGAGSIRTPASCCGLVGLNPSRGRVSRGPDSQDSMFGLVREFVVTRSVRDAAAILDVVHGAGVGDPFMIIKPDRPYIDEVSNPREKMRIAYTVEPWAPYAVDLEIVNAVEKVISICEEMGHIVEDASPSVDHEKVNKAVMDMFGLADAGIAEQAKTLGRELSLEYLEPASLKMIERAKKLSLAEVMESFEVMRQTRLSVGQFFQNYDLLVTPTLALLPQPHGLFSTKRDDLDPLEYWINDSKIFQHQALFNVTGTPSISLPLCQSESGLPIGIQFSGRFGDEAALIRIAGAFEEAMPWSERKPPAHVSK